MTIILKQIQQYLIEHNVDAILIAKGDPHRSEYTSNHDNYVQFVSSFTGSNGFTVVTPLQAVLFTDGRYTIQARQEVDTDYIAILDFTRNTIVQWLTQHLSSNAKILYHPHLFSIDEFKYYQQISQLNNWSLISNNFDFLDKMWVNRPTQLVPEIVTHPLEYAGQPYEEKLHQVVQWLNNNNLKGLFLNTAESIAWLLNIRSPQRPLTPAPACYLWISNTGQAYCFIDDQQLNERLRNQFIGVITFYSYHHLPHFIAQQADGCSIGLDPKECPIYWHDIIHHCGGIIKLINNPINQLKSIKNSVEIDGAIQAHIDDGVALCQAFYWLKKQIGNGARLSEIDVANKLYDLRQQQSQLFKQNSFDAIVGCGPHGAIIHYHACDGTNQIIRQNDIVLIDSGGQYLNGTTDVTRTLLCGHQPSSILKTHYTLVLKGHIALTRQIFPRGTSGSQLDVLARQFLWQHGLDYKHGTGHGVGSYLGVHEGPQNISSIPNNVVLEPDMILSNEPGYYLENQYGIRIESLILVEPHSEKDFLAFRTLTMVPFEPILIDKNLLSPDEIVWIDHYHQQVFTTISPHVSSEVRQWLMDVTQPL